MRRLFLVFLLLLPLTLAVDGDWRYPGETWTEDGIVFSLEGSGHETALLGVGGQLYLLGLYDCRTVGLGEYCYTDTAYPDDEDHMKYEAGERLYGYYITTETYSPSLDVDRELSDESPGIGDITTMTVTIENDGDYRVENLVYEETIPDGLIVVSGPAVGQKIRWTRAALNTNQQDRFTYRVKPVEFGEYTLDPLLSYEYEGTAFNTSPSDESFSLELPITVDRAVTTSLNIDELGRYELNLTNTDDETITVFVNTTPPDGIEIVSAEGLVETANGWEKEYTLGKNDEEEIELEFYHTGSGAVPFPLSITMSGVGATVTETYSDSISSSGGTIEAALLVSPIRNAYRTGMEITVSGVLENVNGEVRFTTVEGTMESELFRTARFSHDTFAPLKKLTEAQVIMIVPEVSEEREETVTFSGSYESPRGREYTFSEEKTLTIVPYQRSVEVARTVSPISVEPGGNITVDVTLKNLAEEYLTLDVHEKFPPGVVKIGGLSYAELSMEKDDEEKAYTYQLEISENYTGGPFNLTTSVFVQGADLPEEYQTEIPVKLPEGVAEEAPEEAQPVQSEDEEETVETEEEPGFFARVWDWIKGLFS